MDFESICRICLEPNEQSFDIFTSYYMKRNILYIEMLSYCTKLKIEREDGLPRLICKECTKLLKKVYIFNLQCEESDKKLRQCVETVPKEENNLLEDVYKNEIDLENDEKVLELLNQDVVADIKDNIKLEPQYNDNGDDNWDADDNMLLEDIKMNKEHDELESSDEQPKKKRGRKRKEAGVRSRSPHQCDVCGKVLSTRSNLKAHAVCHTDLRPFKCPHCDACFRGHSALFQHKKVHSGETPYHCEYCPKRFSRRTGLVNHIRIHTGEKLYNCDICYKTFVQSAQLNIHMKRHKGDKSYLCQDCGKGFSIKGDLKVHQRIHNGEKPYSCHLCSKTFATSGNLAIHVRIHNKEVRYTCKECGRGFVTHSAYSLHVKRHAGQRDHRCDCGKTFYTSSALKQHKVVHTGEKKYQCKICDRKFTQTSHLSRHFKRDHVKPGAPVPSSKQYKIVLQSNNSSFNFIEGDMQRIEIQIDPGVKCEGS